MSSTMILRLASFCISIMFLFPIFTYGGVLVPLVRSAIYPSVLSVVIQFPSGVIDNFILDTGAARIQVGETHFNREYRDLETTETVGVAEGVTASGQEIDVHVYKIHSFKLSDECTLEYVSIGVISGSEMNVIGMNALYSLTPMMLDIDKQTLIGSHCDWDHIEREHL